MCYSIYVARSGVRYQHIIRWFVPTLISYYLIYREGPSALDNILEESEGEEEVDGGVPVASHISWPSQRGECCMFVSGTFWAFLIFGVTNPLSAL